MYAATYEEVFRSPDGGITWERLVVGPPYGRTINFSDLGTGAHAPLLYVTTDLGLVACEPGTC